MRMCWGLGSPGGQKFNFLNTVMSVDQDALKIYPRIKLVTLGWGSNENTSRMGSNNQVSLDIFENRGFAMARHRMCSSLIGFFTSHQQSFSYKGTGLPPLNQY